MKLSNALSMTCVLALIASPVLSAVRTLTIDEKSMAEIHLSMGRSTVLHFAETPTKVIAGNQNYFNIEFTGEDVTLQPLGAVVSNLFVYTEYHRYGFILRVGGGNSYDDLVEVRWRGSQILSPISERFEAEIAEEKKVVTTKTASARLKKTFYDKTLELTVLDLEIENKRSALLEAKQVGVLATQGGKSVPIRKMVFDKDETSAKERQLRARLFLKTVSKRPLRLSVTVGSSRMEISVPGKVFP